MPHSASALGLLRDLARYDLWATERLLLACDELPDADYRRDVGMFFKSVHGTLNHLLVAQHQIWFTRFVTGRSPRADLGAEVEVDRTRLRSALRAGSVAWWAFVDKLDETRLSGTLDYTTTRGQPMSLPFAATLQHVFNHATHHRGQITAGLTMLGLECPVLDMVAMLQHEAMSRCGV